jgi:phage-related protein
MGAMKKSRIIYYENLTGSSPVRKWINNLKPSGNRLILLAAIEELLASQGRNLLSTQWLKSITKGIYELRVKAPNAFIQYYSQFFINDEFTRPDKSLYRIFLFFSGTNEILILHGYDKKSNDKRNFQQKQINIAKKRLDDYLRRKNG